MRGEKRSLLLEGGSRSASPHPPPHNGALHLLTGYFFVSTSNGFVPWIKVFEEESRARDYVGMLCLPAVSSRDAAEPQKGHSCREAPRPPSRVRCRGGMGEAASCIPRTPRVCCIHSHSLVPVGGRGVLLNLQVRQGTREALSSLRFTEHLLPSPRAAGRGSPLGLGLFGCH